MLKKCLGSLVATVLLSLLSATGHAEDAIGLVIYMEPPIGPLKLPEAMPYSSIQKTSIEFSNLKLANGKVVEIHNGGILGIFPFPSGTPDSDAAGEVAELERKAAALTRSYPSTQGALDGLLGKWKVALQAAGRRAQSAAADSTPSLGGLVVKGATYTKVSLAAVNGDKAKIFHSDGVAVIALADLTPGQIASLNSTTKSAHIDPDWKEKKRLADEAEAKRLAAEAEAKRKAHPPAPSASHSAPEESAAGA